MHTSIAVIGAGAGGLVVAIGAAKAGKNVLLIEKGHYGGDCTNFGCIPSKSTLAAAHAAHDITASSNFGLALSQHTLNCEGALSRTRSIVQQVRSHEDPDALAESGVKAITGEASFIDARTLRVKHPDGTETEVTADRIVIATGSRPRIPLIVGIEEVDYLTNETIFDLKEIPPSLAVVGGGPIGCELAQAFRRLGSEVSIIHYHPHLLNKESLHAQEVIEAVFKEEGIALYLENCPTAVKREGDTIVVNTKSGSEIRASHLLLSAGRLPNVETLNLEAAGITYSSHGINVNRYGMTTAKNIYAVGDAAGRAFFTHLAENEARTVLRNLLLPRIISKKLDIKQPIPRVTYTDPEIAHVGLTAKEAKDQYGEKKIAIYHVPMDEVDRAICTGKTEGFIEIVTKRWSSKILGATIVAPRAGEMLMEVSTAMHAGLPLRKLATLIHPYPIYSLGIRKAADMWLIETILPPLKKLFGRGHD